MAREVDEIYGNRVRVRVCGLLVENDSLLLINHRSLAEGDFWLPPGGGVEFAETAKEALKREFLEETGLTVQVNGFLFAHEFVRPPLHAVELFFEVERISGKLKTGYDPEISADRQLLENAKFISWNDLETLPPGQLHNIFRLVAKPAEIMRLNGYLTV